MCARPKAMTSMTDRKDALGITHLMRMGWFRPVHCKSVPAQQVRALLTARKPLQRKLMRFDRRTLKERLRHTYARDVRLKRGSSR